MTVRTEPHPNPFAGLDCFQPVVGGLRHLTHLVERPKRGTRVEFLCGLEYIAGTRQRGREFGNCSTCVRVHVDGPEFWEHDRD
jgi:hypothetical protein